MTWWPKARLALAAGLFVAWLGWLAYLVKTDARPPVLSRLQLLEATVHATATVTADAAGQPNIAVELERVYEVKKSGLKDGETISVMNLADCKGFIGSGKYLLTLAPAEGDAPTARKFRVVPPNPPLGLEGGSSKLPPTIYPWTEAIRRQFESFHKERNDGGEPK